MEVTRGGDTWRVTVVRLRELLAICRMRACIPCEICAAEDLPHAYTFDALYGTITIAHAPVCAADVICRIHSTSKFM